MVGELVFPSENQTKAGAGVQPSCSLPCVLAYHKHLMHVSEIRDWLLASATGCKI